MVKKIIVLIISLFFCKTIFIFSQDRVNSVLPTVKDSGLELSKVTGWSKDKAGQWVSKKNAIPGYHPELISNTGSVVKLKLYNVNYQNTDYCLIEWIQESGYYKYPNIRQDWVSYNASNYQLIKKDDFKIRLLKDQKYNNVLKVYRLSSFTTRKSNKVDTIANDLGSSFQRGVIFDSEFEIFTYYYTKDNVVRFILKDVFPEIELLPDDYYFECSFDEFSGFFNPEIE
jgi:hypothetical protein